MRKGDFKNPSSQVAGSGRGNLDRFQSHRVRKGDFKAREVSQILDNEISVSISSSEKRGF